MTFQEILSNALIFFFAGYETTASTLSFLAYELAHNQDIQDKLFEEVMKNVGEDEADYDNVSNLPYLDMCINETLRKYPPALRLDRTCTHDTDLLGLKVPKGMVVNVPIYAIHHSPDLWENPDKFDPDRYIDDVLSINNSKFADYLSSIYPSELEVKETIETNNSPSYLDIMLSYDTDGHMNTSLYDKRDYFNFSITNFPFLSSNIPSSPAYGVFISQLIRYARASTKYMYTDFVLRARRLSDKLFSQGYVCDRLTSSLRKFYGQYGERVIHYDVPVSRMVDDILS
ncbi:hypothetical protein FSP39_013152 [Pinctada imbricata]|uniref:Cytochrome P450 n=1 Tax=Pinctada imbricata TaxID=66713 RepID=A0AA89C6E9_PINIB|nr:hypothetical protein FSP39_013152 [Pinctada imbricata]